MSIISVRVLDPTRPGPDPAQDLTVDPVPLSARKDLDLETDDQGQKKDDQDLEIDVPDQRTGKL